MYLYLPPAGLTLQKISWPKGNKFVQRESNLFTGSAYQSVRQVAIKSTINQNVKRRRREQANYDASCEKNTAIQDRNQAEIEFNKSIQTSAVVGRARIKDCDKIASFAYQIRILTYKLHSCCDTPVYYTL